MSRSVQSSNQVGQAQVDDLETRVSDLESAQSTDYTSEINGEWVVTSPDNRGR